MSKLKKQKDRFARLFIERLRRGGETRSIKYDRKNFCLIIGGGCASCTLDNLFHYYQSLAGDAQENFLHTHVRNWFVTQKPIPTCFADVKADLLPKLESRAELEAEKLEDQFGERPYHVIGEHLGLTLVYDWPNAIRWLGQHELRMWGVSFDEAIEIAKHNLATLAPPVLASPRPGLYVSHTGDNYDAARLILVPLIKELPVRGSHIAIPANRDTLIITGTDDEEGLAAMAEIAATAISEPYSVTSSAFRLAEDDWVPWLPDPEHPLFNTFKRMQVESVAEGYRTQKMRLDTLPDEGVFVATYNAIKNQESGQVSTYSVWGSGITSWLPRTDTIGFSKLLDMERGICDCRAYDWDQVVQVVGHLMKPLDLYPPRYEVTEFPTDEQFAAMGAPFIL
jgi:hypothetical protein